MSKHQKQDYNHPYDLFQSKYVTHRIGAFTRQSKNYTETTKTETVPIVLAKKQSTFIHSMSGPYTPMDPLRNKENFTVSLQKLLEQFQFLADPCNFYSIV